MQLTCPSCSAFIGAADVDLGSGTAKCAACNSVFAFRDQVTASMPARETIGIPERFTVDERSAQLRIEWSASRDGVAFMVVFLVFWFGFLILWNGIALWSGVWMMSLFSLLHVAAGVGIGLGVARRLKNTTTLEVDRQTITLKSGPVPGGPKASLSSTSIDQVFVVAREHRSKSRRWSTYDVVAKTRDGRETRVVTGLEDKRAALFLEQRIEKYLRIEDRPMPGAITG